MSVVERIRLVIAGYSLPDVARLLGEKEHRVKSVIYGRQRIPEDFLINFLGVFKVDANWLLLGVGEPPQAEDQREAILVDHFRHCDDRGKEALLATGAALAQPKKMKGAG